MKMETNLENGHGIGQAGRMAMEMELSLLEMVNGRKDETNTDFFLVLGLGKKVKGFFE